MASSVYGGDPKKWGSSLATDGKIKGGVADTGFFSTSFENSPWIRVDLKDNLIIAFVRVFNRMYKLGERLHDVALEVSRGDGYEQRGYFRGPGVTNQVVDILCDPPSPGRYVRLKIINGENNILQIDEMEIYTLF
ncbi:uncharacterized protein LOC134276725 [Saccostrea cucullata]|uniref:uncharacterized protein LOC134276725 n=1 Tax=Saccostrea cuccullata TaxID=36930 RepID=UPI002ED15A58